MSLLSQQQNQQPSKEELLTQKVKRIKDFTRQGYIQILAIQQQGINMLWNDQRLTPQEIIDALGSEALKIFQMHSELTDTIVNIAAIDGTTPEVSIPTNAFEIVDGEIIVSPHPYTL